MKSIQILLILTLLLTSVNSLAVTHVCYKLSEDSSKFLEIEIDRNVPTSGKLYKYIPKTHKSNRMIFLKNSHKYDNNSLLWKEGKYYTKIELIKLQNTRFGLILTGIFETDIPKAFFTDPYFELICEEK